MKEKNVFACRLDALTETERARRLDLFTDFRNAVQGIDELANGYEIALDLEAVARETLDELLGLERRCCPFLEFEISDASQAVIVRITGTQDVKDFLKGEFGLGTP